MPLTTEERAVLDQYVAVCVELKDAYAAREVERKKLGGDVQRCTENISALESKAADIVVQMTGFAAKVDGVATKLEEHSGLIRALGERISKPPAGAPGQMAVNSFAERLTESPEWKAQRWEGRSRFQTTIQGPMNRKAVAPFVSIGASGVLVPTRYVGVVQAPTLPLVMRDLMPVIPLTGTNAIEYQTETWTYAADYQILEGDKKAQGDVTYTPKVAMVVTIAWFVKVSRQMLADVPFIQSTIENRLIYGVLKKEDYELLWGDGTPGHLQGIMPIAGTLPATPVFPVDYPWDDIGAAAATLAANGYPPTAVVVNPLDWAMMNMVKNQFGNYVLGSAPAFGGPPVGLATPTLWGLQVASTPNMTQNNYLVGSFPANCALFDRETATVDIAFENEDDFVRNLVTIRCEERVAAAWYVPGAFIKGTFPVIAPGGLTAKTAPTTPAGSPKK